MSKNPDSPQIPAMSVPGDLGRLRALLEQLSAHVETVEQRLEALENTPAREGRQSRRRDRRSIGAGGADTGRSSPTDAGSNRLVALLRIPACGMIANTLLTAVYPESAVYKTGDYLSNAEKTERRITRRQGRWERWIKGGGRATVLRVPYKLAQPVLPSDTVYITFLQNPVERVLMHYQRNFHRRARASAGDATRTWTRQERIPKAETVREALLEMRVPPLINLATRFLCNDFSPAGTLPAAALEDAKANLRAFAFVGLEERLAESLALLQRTLGLDLLAVEAPDIRSTPVAPEFPDEDRAIVAECNQLDLELFRFAQTLFDDAIRAAGDDGFTADVNLWRERLSTLSQEREEDRSLPGVTR